MQRTAFFIMKSVPQYKQDDVKEHNETTNGKYWLNHACVNFASNPSYSQTVCVCAPLRASFYKKNAEVKITQRLLLIFFSRNFHLIVIWK